MLEIQNCCLVVVDVQGKLAQLMTDKEALFKNIQILIQAAKVLGIPILWCQQVPAALGPTVPEIAELLAGTEPVDKASFSCCGEERFNAELNSLAKEQVLLCGIETHVCVYQTAMDLMEGGLDVTIIADAVSSRTDQNRQIALTRLAAEGAHISSSEMALFELLKTAKHPVQRNCRARQIAARVVALSISVH
jgi:nicotinamidase-related amidase